MKTRWPWVEILRRRIRWSAPLALLALTPKCFLCIASYAGLGALLGLGGPEICGAPAGSPGSWASSLAWLGVAGAIGCLAKSRSTRSAPPQKSNHC